MKQFRRLMMIFCLTFLLISCSSPGSSAKNQIAESYAPCLLTEASYTSKDIQWLKENIIPYKISTLSDNGLPIKELDKVIIIGIGESTHGSHEITETKIEFTKYLIQYLNFKIVALELPYFTISKLNDYINGGGGNLTYLLEHARAWIINTDEMFNLMHWLKNYNDHAIDNDKVTLIGFDISIDEARPDVDAIINYYKLVDPEYHNKSNSQLACIVLEPYLYRQLSTIEKEECRAKITDLSKTLEKNRTTYIYFSSLDQFELALFQVNMLLQQEELIKTTGEAAYSLRDQFMKENVVWIHEVLGRHEKKIVLWGHNTHIGRNLYEKTNSGTMGFLLNEHFGDKYLPIGLTFWEGEFNAIPMTTSHTADTPPVDSYEAFFHSISTSLFFIQISKKSTPKWLGENHCLRSIGAIFDPKEPEYGWDVDQLSDEFDGFFYINTSSPTNILE